MRRRHQRRNLLYAGGFLVPLVGLAGWCLFSGVFALPAAYAANAVPFAALPPWAVPPATAGRHGRAEAGAAPDRAT